MVAKSKDLDLQAVVNALDVLVIAYCAERSKRPPSEGPLCVPASEIPLMSREEAYRERIVKEPFVGALKLSIRELGKYIWQKTGSSDPMQDVLYAVAQRHTDNNQEIIHMIDHAWDSIGDWYA